MLDASITRPRRVGHKGAAHIEPGNTLASFDAALHHGVDMIELDVLAERPDGSGRLLVAHDYRDMREREPLRFERALEHLSSERFAQIELDVDVKLGGYEHRVLGALRDFDLIGRRYTGHTLATGTVMVVNFVSYAFNLCIGSIVGGVGFRYRLYSQLGLGKGVITRIVSMSMLTNWLGYKLLAGLLFLIHPLALPPSWKMGNHGLQWIGAGLVLISAAYIAACVRRPVRVDGRLGGPDRAADVDGRGRHHHQRPAPVRSGRALSPGGTARPRARAVSEPDRSRR